MSRYASNSNIFDQEEVLREDHHPDELPERSEEFDQLHMALSPAARGVGANNVFLYGKAGQGKTAAAKKELSELQYHAEQESDHLDLTALYISCESHDISTSFRAASRIYMELTGNDRPTGYSTDAVVDMMYDAMNEIGGTIIIVLDEIDSLGTDDRILYSLPRARSQGYVNDNVYLSVIGISNDLQWRDNLSPKVKSSLYDDYRQYSVFITNTESAFLAEYGHRWEIESGYRSIKRFIAATTSKHFGLRFFYFAFACLLYSIWRAVDLLVQVELTGKYEHSPIVTTDNTLTLLKKETGIG